MDFHQIEDEYSMQTITLTNKQVVNIFDKDQFTDKVTQMIGSDEEESSEETIKPKNTDASLVLMFFTHKQPETLYRTFPLIAKKHKNRCYLNDIFLGLFDITQLKFIESSTKYLLKPSGKVIKYIPVTANMFSDIGKHYISSYLLGAENLNNPQSLASNTEQATEDNGNKDGNKDDVVETLAELMNAHNKPKDEKPKNEEVTFVENQASLTEVTADVMEKVKSGISSVATAVDSMSKKQNVYIILERRYLNAEKAIQIYHIYSNKRLISSTLADEFAPILLSLVNLGQVRIKEVEEVITENGEWEAPKKL